MASEASDGPDRRGSRSRRLLWGLGVVVAATVVAGALASGLREPAAFPEGTPQRTVQAYVEAVLERDYERALTYLSEDLAGRCSVDDFSPRSFPEPLTVRLDDVHIANTRAEVTLRLRTDPGEPELPLFESSGYPEHFVLTERDGMWVIDEGPWPIYHCGGIH